MWSCGVSIFFLMKIIFHKKKIEIGWNYILILKSTENYFSQKKNWNRLKLYFNFEIDWNYISHKKKLKSAEIIFLHLRYAIYKKFWWGSDFQSISKLKYNFSRFQFFFGFWGYCNQTRIGLEYFYSTSTRLVAITPKPQNPILNIETI